MVPRFTFAAFSLLLLGGCPKAPPALPPAPQRPSAAQTYAEVHPLVFQAQSLLRAQDEAVWKAWIDGGSLDLSASYSGSETLFSPQAIATVERARAAAMEARDVRALTHLKSYLTSEYLARALQPQADAIAHLEASMTFPVEGREVPYRELERLLTSERNTAKRRALYAAATPAIERLTQSLKRKESRLGALIAELGYPSYEAYGAELRQVEPDALAALAEEVLESTQALYTQALGKAAQRELTLGLAELRRADLPRLVRPRGQDGAFPKESLLQKAQDTLRGMGLELTAMGNLTLDLTEAQQKNPRRLSLAVVVPTDVRLSMRPVGGARDQANLFHELGHSLHYGLSTESRFELSKLGNHTVSEAYAFLLEDLLEDPAWLAQHTKLSGEGLTQHLQAATLSKLFALRKAAGTVLYDLALRRHEGADPQELHRQILSRAYAVRPTDEDAARHGVDGEELYESADELRAWVLAGQLQAQLKARFGEAWWQSPAAGILLRQLWASANGLSAEEVAQKVGEAGLRPNALLVRLAANLGQPLAPAPPAPKVADPPAAQDAGAADGGFDSLSPGGFDSLSPGGFDSLSPGGVGSPIQADSAAAPEGADGGAWRPQRWRTPKQVSLDAG